MQFTKDGEQQERCYSTTGRLSQYFAIAVQVLAVGWMRKSYKKVYYSDFGRRHIICALKNSAQ
ncbi:hypothetical protein SOASR015_31020 [Pectobacterium carotovorum subsp. carotovorum]|nr:hypothetical protein SOASR015_31020 [Pectobacterium carotovorum subsp. carotovorum]GLX57716.1 hypothetical protein Pcaca02_30250 [Pectobacterium carotovorum subsp. carotovorum]